MSSRMPLGANVRGPNAWILWQAAHGVLRERLRQLEVDPRVHRDIVRGFRATLGDLELAATEYRNWERSCSAADSAEVSPGGREAGSDCPSGIGTGLTARELNCSPRWVIQLIAMGRLRAVRVGRDWRIDPDSVEDYKLRGADAA